jgi:DNA-binding NarL/FixJ family response regulator
MRILIVDDHPLVLQGLATVLEKQGWQVVQAINADQARQALLEYFDVLLLDYNLQIQKGTDLLTDEIQRPGKIILISGITDPDIILYILETTKVDAFVSKQTNPEVLPVAIRQLTESPLNEPCLWLDNTETFVKARDAYPKSQILTPKEREVFMLLRQGLLDKQIAEQLHRSIHTIRVQIRSIKRKRGKQRRISDADF